MTQAAVNQMTTIACTRCRSENVGDLKFCRYCGSRLRGRVVVSHFVPPQEVRRSSRSAENPAPITRMKEPPKRSDQDRVEQAKRFVFLGKQHFATGELKQAAGFFRQALALVPGHPQLLGFLRRVDQMEAQLHRSQQAPVNTKEARRGSPPVANRCAGRSSNRESAEVISTKQSQIRPLSPALVMDQVSRAEEWNERLAGFLAIIGLLAFGWLLIWW